jgi:hypothetical protein
VLIQSDAYIDKLVADEVVGLYFPLFAEAACRASGLDLDHLARQQVELKGRVEPLDVRVMRIG